MTGRIRTQTGATMVELVISIVIIGVALAGVMITIVRNAGSSSDPMVQHQAIAIAEAYLEEALSKEFTDPDGVGGEARPDFDDVSDFNGLVNNGARNQNNEPIASLESYNVTMSVTAVAFNGIPNTDALLVQVTVTPPFGVAPITMSAYRTNYN